MKMREPILHYVKKVHILIKHFYKMGSYNAIMCII